MTTRQERVTTCWKQFTKTRNFAILQAKLASDRLDMEDLLALFSIAMSYGKDGIESLVDKINISDYESWCSNHPEGNKPPTLLEISSAFESDYIRGLRGPDGKKL